MVEDRDLGLKQVRASLQYLNTHSAKFGWVSQPEPESKGEGRGGDSKEDDDGNKTEVTVAKVARAHELGLGTLKGIQPPRSALIATLDERTAQIDEMTAEFIGPVFEGKLIGEIGIRLLAEGIVDLIKDRYVSQENWKPLSEERKAQKVRGGKSGNQARIYTGQELNAIRYEIGPF
ncbi:MAG: hypothetical protein V3V82_02885 [Acidimicrobiia bacterium]